MFGRTLFAFAALALVGGAQALADEPFRLIVTHMEPPLVPNSVMDLAAELGYFEREGVDVEIVRVQQTPLALAALQAGEGEMANVSVDAVLQLVARRGPVVTAVASPNRAIPFLIAAREEVRTVDDLAGRTFGIGRLGSLDHSLSAKVIEASGVAMDAVDVVPLGQPGVRAQALAAGRIDATTMSIGTWLAIPDRTGLHVLVPQDAYHAAAPVVNKVNAVTPEVLAGRRDEVVAVVRALTRLSRDFAADPATWAEAIAPYAPGLDADARLALATSFAGSWSIDGGLDREELAFTQEWLAGTADFAETPAVAISDWVDFSVVEEVVQDLGPWRPADGSGL